MTRTTTLDQVLQEAEVDSMGALSADFRAAHSALLPDGLSIARVGSAQVSRFGLAPSHPLPLLRSRCHGIVRAENLVRGPGQQGCSPGQSAVMITGHVPAVRVPPDYASRLWAAAVAA